ncbi:hypothetical protein OG339_15930 [Streptosporangium sp. NBC_01495]|uniref:hypothetical protein n=1 Tax=Streptosporangium sp. NBC_01495 TaxID=2903899 RepID=UPI002E373142|nr:hypothetical protein [Streptosporangium sp. NBC_01495]
MIAAALLTGTPAVHAAEQLSNALEQHGIVTDVHGGYGVAVVSVWVDLLVWTDGFVYHWWAGQFSGRSRRRLYTVYTVDNPAAAARCVAHRYEELQQGYPVSPLLHGDPL